MATKFKIFNIVKGPLRFLKEWGVFILFAIVIALLIYVCKTI